MALRKSKWVWWVLSGVLLGVGFVLPALWWLGLGGVAAFWHASTKTPRLRTVVLGGIFVWSIKSAFAISWFWSVYPLTWLGFESGAGQLSVIAFYWLTISFALGTGGGFVALAAYYLRAIPIIAQVLCYSVVWVAGEVLSAVLFSVLNIGPGSTVNAFFSTGYVGYLAAYHPWLLSMATMAGVYSLSATLVLLGLIIFQLYRTRKFLLLGVITSFVIIPPVANTDTSHANDQVTTTVAIIDTMFTPNSLDSQQVASERALAIEAAITAALQISPQYILLPEDTRYFATTLEPTVATSLFNFTHAGASTTIIDSGRATTQDKNVLQAFIYDAASGDTYHPQKKYLVPQGEYLPYSFNAVLRAVGLGELAASYNSDRAYSMGDPSLSAPPHIPSVLFCFESLSPVGVQRLVGDRPDVSFIVHPISHSWFNEPTALWQQLDQMLRVQAVWNDIAIVSAANEARGKLYLPTGDVITPTPLTGGTEWNVRLVTLPLRLPKVDQP